MKSYSDGRMLTLNLLFSYGSCCRIIKPHKYIYMYDPTQTTYEITSGVLSFEK